MLRIAVNAGIVIALLAALSGAALLRDRTAPQAGSVVDASLENGAAVYGVDTITADKLLADYASATAATSSESRIKVFVMPGHEPSYGGAEYRDLKERDMNVELAEDLADFLRADPHYEVVMGRSERGWNPDLYTYFTTKRDEIVSWRDAQKKMTSALKKEGTFEENEGSIAHAAAPKDAALRLYGINKWVGENDFDMAIHIHFNDYGSRRASKPGEYSGYAIYVPDKQYSNSAAAKMLADSMRHRLDYFIAESDMPKEGGGVVEDQSLIALGSNNSADVPSILIEYGYIYEPQFQVKAVRDAVLKEYAYQTYLGLGDFFDTNAKAVSYDTDILPHTWESDLKQGQAPSLDVLALQFALTTNHAYPPEESDLHICPISGVFGSCTKSALAAFQKRYELQGEEGSAGWKTRAFLNSMFGYTPR